ncbi:hypothetical protein DM01DRAFT_1349836 [Hesseltinella vesiculosa]|uniref:Uncharacterized protein n=1 Tax=Hesseltinella vesiculosa TaxID=101127 RepID=A0A1X2G3M2_9FUNG|nr:hypothetical protein DM01DRAFT_1378585 [Hesseltinella vesiculosa]ORX43989.1 hypothetical protein DM01DRAFT_1349836 [Hesseltinella vesiculosa]
MNNNDNFTRPNPQQCRGCRFPCQQVLLHSPLAANNAFNVQEWWESLLSVVPPIAGLAHVRQFGDSLSVHFVNPRSAHFFFHHPARWRALMRMHEGIQMTISPARVDGHTVQYHREPHPHQVCHLARNRPAHASVRRPHQTQARPPSWANRRHRRHRRR